MNNKIIRTFLIFIIFLAFSVLGKSQNNIIPVDIATQKAADFLKRLKSNKNIEIDFKDFYPVKLIKNNTLIAYQYDLLPQGFIIVSPYNVDNSIMAYSYENDFSSENEIYETSLNILEGIRKADQHNNSSDLITRNPTTEIGPLVKSLFGQVNCRDANGNIVNVSNIYTPNHYAPGCVAVSLATMMDYYQWPVQGKGEHIDYDNKGSSKGNYKAVFSETQYDWEHILNRYNNKNTTKQEKEALGLLVYHAAIALDMDFEYTGSTSNVNRIPATGKNYFRFNAKYASASSPIFWKTVDSCIVHKIPVVFAISATNGAGHSIICDGVRFDNGNSTFHHLNMGWWGSSNGWYRVKSSFNAGGYSKIDGGTINFLPIPEIYDTKVNSDSTYLTVYWRYSTVLTPEAFELQAKYDYGNWKTISDTLSQDSLNITLNSFEKTAQFRIRAKLLGKYSNDSWSNTVEFKKQTSSNKDLTKNSSIEIYPNPVKDHFELKNNGNTPFEIIIFNSISQKIVFYKKSLKITETINTYNWKSGEYIILIRSDKLSLQKIIKID